MENTGNSLLGIGEAAEYLGVSKDTLRRWEREGKLTPFRTPGNQRRYSLALLRELLRKRENDEIYIEPEAIAKPIKKEEPEDEILQTSLEEPLIKEGDTAVAEKKEAPILTDNIQEVTIASVEEGHNEKPISPLGNYKYTEEVITKEEPYLPHPPIISDLEQSISQSLNEVREMLENIDTENKERAGIPTKKDSFRKFYEPKKPIASVKKRLITSIAASLVALGLIALGMSAVAYWSEKQTANIPVGIVSPLP